MASRTGVSLTAAHRGQREALLRSSRTYHATQNNGKHGTASTAKAHLPVRRYSPRPVRTARTATNTTGVARTNNAAVVIWRSCLRWLVLPSNLKSWASRCRDCDATIFVGLLPASKHTRVSRKSDAVVRQEQVIQAACADSPIFSNSTGVSFLRGSGCHVRLGVPPACGGGPLRRPHRHRSVGDGHDPHHHRQRPPLGGHDNIAAALRITVATRTGR